MTKINWSGRAHNYSQKDINYLVNVIKSADPLTQGKFLNKFEIDLSKYLKTKNIFAVSSAAAALEIIALLISLKKGDEVIIPAHTYCASAISFARNGAKIVWADINFNTRTINIDDVKKKITKKTKAIVVVHLYGYASNFESLVPLCKKKKIKIVEDCAQAFGAEIKKRKVGTIGDYACFSFHAQKNITTLGEGGAIRVKNNKLAKKVKGLRHNGHCDYKKRKFYWKPAMGNLDLDLNNKWPYKFTLSEIQCAAGIVMLKKLDKLNKIRVNRAKKAINSLSKFKELIFFDPKKNKQHVYHLLSAYYEPSKKINRDSLIEILYNKFNIKCAVQYYPLYNYPLFKKMGFGLKKKLKNTEKFYNNMVSFPFHVWLKENEFEYLISSVKKSLEILQKSR
jgi:perosamine synthetase